MEEKNENINGEEIMLPGFRFHPTDEELVGFYLKRKIQQRPLSIELIKQLDIYKFDPWDLPKLAGNGEKEWYFYCPRDRKYRNSARPNRVTGAGFWKATGTDRPIYSSEGTKCIGLKKSLVFYKGRAAKGIKTDWMMHEFRLPSLADSSPPAKRFMEKTIPANDSWAICRIFKKTNSTTQRALSHSWVSPVLPQNITTTPSLNDIIIPSLQMTSSDQSITSANYNNNNMHHSFSNPNFSSYKLTNFVTTNNKPYYNNQLPNISNENLTNNSMFSSIVDPSSLLLNMSSSILGDFGRFSHDQSNNLEFLGSFHQENPNSFSMYSTNPHLYDEEASLISTKSSSLMHCDENQMDQTLRCIGFPMNVSDSWKTNTIWSLPALAQPGVGVPSEIDT
ncbi:hypothetical protein ACFE04_024144 [Oxalis oulophora]